MSEEKYRSMIGNQHAKGNSGNPNSEGRPKIPEEEKLNQRIVIMVTEKVKKKFSEKIKKTRTKPRQIILDFIKKA